MSETSSIRQVRGSRAGWGSDTGSGGLAGVAQPRLGPVTGGARPGRRAQARGSRLQRRRAMALAGDKAAPARPGCSGRCWASTKADPGSGEDCCNLRLVGVEKKIPASSPSPQLLLVAVLIAGPGGDCRSFSS